MGKHKHLLPKDKKAKGPAISSVFDRKAPKRKFDVLGVKRKSDSQDAVLSRTRGLQKREETLLVEYKNRFKNNAFLDRRFGEGDESLSAEDRMLLRYQKERMREAQQAQDLYGIGEEMSLTHGGRVIDDGFDFGDGGREEYDDSDDEGAMRMITDGKKDEERRKTSKEIYEEIIAKSKKYKAEKAKARDEQDEMLDNIDAQFTVLKPVIMADGQIRKKTTDAPADDFDAVKEALLGDVKAYASDRLKSEEEIAAELKAKLDKLERDRQKRMQGEDGDDPDAVPDEDVESIADDADDNAYAKRRQGNSLAYVIASDGKGLKSTGLPGQKDGDDESEGEGSDEDEEEGAGSSEEDDQEDEDDDEEGDDEEDEDDDDEANEDVDVLLDGGLDDIMSDEGEQIAQSKGSRKTAVKASADDLDDGFDLGSSDEDDDGESVEDGKAGAKDDGIKVEGGDEIPFVIAMPSTHKEFYAELVSKYPAASQLDVIVKRIRANYHVSLAAENRMKLAAFFGILLKEYMRTDDMSCQDVIARHLFEMANKYFEQAAVDECAKQVQKIHARISERNCVLSINESMFIALVARLFSATDFRHKIVTPALLVLGQSLSQCAISHPVDLVHGLFSCSVMVNVLRPVKRYAPELLTFIEGVLSLLVKGKADPACLRSTVPAESVTLVDASKKDLAKAAKSDLTSFRQLLSDASADEWSLSTRVQVMTLALQVADSYLVVLANLSPLPEMCQSFMDLVEAAPAALQAMPSVSKVRNAIQKRAGDALAVRQPLRMQTFAPKSIKMLNPKFEESFKATKDHDPDRERARVKKLQREVKDAKKNAMRELQRDAEFMAEERRKRKRDLDDREAQVVRNVNTILEQQQQMANTLDRMVKKPRRQ